MQSKMHSIITTTILSLSPFWLCPVIAADKTETLKGTITLGSGGYGIKLDNGKLIRFMGRGGNKVFAACHNGDTCEITGVVVYDTKTPLFLSVTRVRKLAGPAQVPTVDSPPTKPNAAVPPPAKPMTKPVTAEPAPPDKAKKTEPRPQSTEEQSPLLLDNNNGH